MMRSPEQPAVQIYRQTIPTPIGAVTLECTERGLTHARITADHITHSVSPTHPILQLAVEALINYFDNPASNSLDLIPLDLSSLSPYHLSVLALVKEVPTGQTITYKQLALQIGGATHTRAVANANAKNPIPIFIPCHRVIGTNGSLTGYALGLPIKKWLLDHEKSNKQLQIQF